MGKSGAAPRLSDLNESDSRKLIHALTGLVGSKQTPEFAPLYRPKNMIEALTHLRSAKDATSVQLVEKLLTTAHALDVKGVRTDFLSAGIDLSGVSDEGKDGINEFLKALIAQSARDAINVIGKLDLYTNITEGSIIAADPDPSKGPPPTPPQSHITKAAS